MAATASGKDKILRYARIYVGGYDLSGDALTIGNLGNRFGEAPQMGWSESHYNFISSGIREDVSINGFRAIMNDATNRSADLLNGSPNQNPVSFLFGGGGEPAVPDPVFMMPGYQLSDRSSFDSNIGIIEADFKYDQAQYDAYSGNPLGVLLQPATSYSATQTNASHDNGGSTANGWWAILQVLASSGGTWAFTLEDGTDDSAWANLGTFSADGSTVTSEILSGSGTVDRYVRAVSTRTSGSVTAIITFARA